MFPWHIECNILFVIICPYATRIREEKEKKKKIFLYMINVTAN